MSQLPMAQQPAGTPVRGSPASAAWRQQMGTRRDNHPPGDVPTPYMLCLPQGDPSQKVANRPRPDNPVEPPSGWEVPESDVTNGLITKRPESRPVGAEKRPHGAVGVPWGGGGASFPFVFATIPPLPSA